MDFKLGGIVSGLDTSDLISKIMQIERQPISLMKSRQRTYEFKKDLWTDINTSLLALKTSNDKLLDVNTFKKRTATTTNDAVVTATANDAAAEATYDINITALAKNRQLKSDYKPGWTWAGVGAETFVINDGAYQSNITINPGENLQKVADKINAAKDNADPSKSLRVTATIINDTLVLSHDETGLANTITLTDSANKILNNLGVLDAGGAIKNSVQLQQDAAFTVNGINVTRSRNDNLSDVISGVTLNLRDESNATVTVKKDVDAAYASVKAFIDQYNSTIDLINTKNSEEKVKEPLTDSDRKKGLLRGDSILAGIKGKLRRDVSDPVSGLPKEYDRLSVIGITTTSDDFGKSGKLQINETEFKDALAANPDAVIQLFTNNADTNVNGKIEFSEKGVAQRISDELKALTDTTSLSVGGHSVKNGVIANKLDYFGQVIDDYDERIIDFEERLKIRERALWSQFTEMEKMLSNLNNQGSWLAGQLTGLQQ